MKAIAILGTLLLSAVHLFAQGSVVFSNTGGPPVIYNNGTRVPVGSSHQAELMYAPDGTSPADFATMAVRQGNAANFGPTTGFFSGGGRTVDSITPPGGFGLFQVRVWQTAYGTSYQDAINHSLLVGIGKSAIIRVDTANPLIGEANVGLVSAGLGQIVLETPEPSVVALALIGGGVLLLFARKGAARSESQSGRRLPRSEGSEEPIP
jgi:hypothetical protein